MPTNGRPNALCAARMARSAVARAASSPAAGLEELGFLDGGGGEALHGAGDLLAGFGDDPWIVVVGGGDDDGPGTGDCFGAFFGIVFDIERGGALLHEDSGTDEDCFGA